MLKRINPVQAELGMFIHKLEGSWLKHPFWRSRFLLEDPATLEDLRLSEIDAVVIDISKGRDVEVTRQRIPTAPGPAAQAPSSAPPARRSPFVRREPPPFDFASTQRTTTGREFGHAQTVAKRGEKVVSRVFLNARLGKAVNCNEVEPVISDIFASVQRNPHAFNGLMRCKRENQFTFQHTLAVSALMISLAKTMRLTPAQIRDAGMAGLLLDVGFGHLPLDLEEAGGDYREFGEGCCASTPRWAMTIFSWAETFPRTSPWSHCNIMSGWTVRAIPMASGANRSACCPAWPRSATRTTCW